jgi:hypothetical protein
VRTHAAVERFAAAQRPEGGPVVEPRGAVLVPEDRDLVPVGPAPPQKLGAAYVKGGGDEDAHAPAQDLVERRQQRLGLSGDERVDQDRVLAVAQRVRRHRRRDAVPGDVNRQSPEATSSSVDMTPIIAPIPLG